MHFVDHLLGEDKLKVPTIVMNDIETHYKVSTLEITESIDHSALSDAEKEAARLLESYATVEQAEENVDSLAKACSACHGKKGISKIDDYPNIARQSKFYLISALKEYKKGTRKNEKMNAIFKDINDKQIEELAEYYANIAK